MKFDSVDSILDFAIQKEQDAADFYTRLAEKADRRHMKDIFTDFAREEMGHKAKLEGVKKGKVFIASEKNILDLKIGDYLTDARPSPEMEYQEALILAMKAEKEAFRLYTDLAGAVDDPNLKEIFKALAQEEAKHKLRFEIEYDDNIYKEN
ncbi:MAG: ferritin family protein [bacterium]|nr:ferritin family protein [bacterium]